MSSDVLSDERYLVPTPTGSDAGVGWLRSRVARFGNGEAALSRRRLAEAVIDRIGEPSYERNPTATLLLALGLAPELEDDVAALSAAYLPTASPSPEAAARADGAADRLVAACGGRTDEAAAVVGVLAQSHTATAALVDRIRTGSTEPPVPTTRRLDPDGVEVVVDLRDAWFGRGPHRCPGETLARHLAARATATD